MPKISVTEFCQKLQEPSFAKNLRDRVLPKNLGTEFCQKSQGPSFAKNPRDRILPTDFKLEPSERGPDQSEEETEEDENGEEDQDSVTYIRLSERRPSE